MCSLSKQSDGMSNCVQSTRRRGHLYSCLLISAPENTESRWGRYEFVSTRLACKQGEKYEKTDVNLFCSGFVDLGVAVAQDSMHLIPVIHESPSRDS
jgi:hypothetical protein